MKPGKILSMVGYFGLNYLPLKSFETGCPMLCCFILVVSCLTRTTARVASLHYGALQWHAAPSRMPNEACDHIRCINKRGSWPLAVINFSQMLDVLTFSSPLFTWHRINTWGAFRIWIWHLLLCPHVWVLCQAATQREKHHPPLPTEIQASRAKTYPPKDSKRSEENGKNPFNFFRGLRCPKEAKLLNSAPVIFDSWPT